MAIFRDLKAGAGSAPRARKSSLSHGYAGHCRHHHHLAETSASPPQMPQPPAPTHSAATYYNQTSDKKGKERESEVLSVSWTHACLSQMFRTTSSLKLRNCVVMQIQLSNTKILPQQWAIVRKLCSYFDPININPARRGQLNLNALFFFFLLPVHK